MRTEDIVVLKMGRQYAHGIGVVGNYEYVDEFNDIDGWDLGHARRVRWLHRECSDFGASIFAVSATARLHHERALSWIRKTLGPIDDDGSWRDVEPLDFTADGGRSFDLTEDELAGYLFE